MVRWSEVEYLELQIRVGRDNTRNLPIWHVLVNQISQSSLYISCSINFSVAVARLYTLHHDSFRLRRMSGVLAAGYDMLCPVTEDSSC
jgi:hypothetical protein